jgi:two-component system, cell cycle sensor histidine kinase and response regulator CckA
VLYLDDEETLVSLMTRQLRRRGYHVDGYVSAKNALETLRRDPNGTDVVVTDNNMPKMSGLAFIAELTKIRPDLPVILTSGYIDDELRAAAHALGVLQVVYKPDTIDGLCDAIERVVVQLPAHRLGSR